MSWGCNTSDTLLGFSLPSGLPVTSPFSSCWCAGRGEFSADSALPALLSPRGTRAGSPTACFSGELYLPTREASCRLPGGMKALLPLQPVSGCVPSARRREQPRLTQGAPTRIPGTPTAKAAELQVTIQKPGSSGFSLVYWSGCLWLVPAWCEASLVSLSAVTDWARCFC